ncbi:MAG: type II secretory pathway component PulJ [Sulfurimonas sp.]|jgi:type II secretory pathway component PulJ
MIDLSFINIEYIVVAMAAMILYLLYYVFSKDSEFHKNIRSVASVVEDLNREIFYLKKDLTTAKTSMKNNNTRMSDAEIYEEVERTVYDMVNPLSVGVQRLEDTLVTMDEQINLRIASLENGVKQISIPTSVHGNDDQKIISLFKQGVSLDTISKELHISKAEVEFVLKINKIK